MSHSLTPWTAARCPGSPVLHQLLELTQTHAHRVGDAISSSVIPFSSRLQYFPASGSFPISWFFASSGQSIVVSASASVPPMNIQDWFPLGLTGLISLQSTGLSRVFSSTTVQKYQYFSAQLSLWSNCHNHTWLLEKPQLWQMDLCHQSEAKLTQSRPTLCDPMGYTVHGILQARILEWVAFLFRRGSSQPRDWTKVYRIAGRFFTSRATREAHKQK